VGSFQRDLPDLWEPEHVFQEMIEQVSDFEDVNTISVIITGKRGGKRTVFRTVVGEQRDLYSQLVKLAWDIRSGRLPGTNIQEQQRDV